MSQDLHHVANGIIEVVHTTRYEYPAAVRLSINEARLHPISDNWQTCLDAELVVDPPARFHAPYRDYFGTLAEPFDVETPHTSIEITGRSTVSCIARPTAEQVVDAPRRHRMDPYDPCIEYTLVSPMVRWDDEIEALAKSLQKDTVVATALAVNDWLTANLTYSTGSTEVGTSVSDVLAQGQGVCQDFAHVACALLRCAGVAARYVSGYFSSVPLETGISFRGEGHAWVEVLVREGEWWAFDPTNDQPAGDRHVKVGHGRDYSDVVPLRGVYQGGAFGSLRVDVTMRRLAAAHTLD
ncbi:transglutaminase family protein [Acidothermaceae bacterium B102]|nr:transglutaminase family protein [Acidothermaceae bacterium B102]